MGLVAMGCGEGDFEWRSSKGNRHGLYRQEPGVRTTVFLPCAFTRKRVKLGGMVIESLLIEWRVFISQSLASQEDPSAPTRILEPFEDWFTRRFHALPQSQN